MSRVGTKAPDEVFALAVSHHQSGRLEQAGQLYRQLLVASPNNAAALGNLGIALTQSRQFAAANRSLCAALRLAPDLAGAHAHRGHVLHGLGDVGAAVASLRCALILAPDQAGAYHMLGNRMMDLGFADRAVTAYRRALIVTPDFAKAHCNLGSAWQQLGRTGSAARSFTIALCLAPDYAEAHANQGRSQSLLGQLDNAIAACGRAIRLAPDLAAAHYNQSFPLLLKGSMTAAWPKYEWRWKMGGPWQRDLKRPRWDGQNIFGQRILLHAEQGIGDTLLFCRYVPKVAALGTEVLLETHPSVVRLLSGLKGVGSVIGAGRELPDYDCHMPLMSLPGLFGTDLDTVPAPIPYLRPEPDRVEHWRTKLGSDGFKIGISWQGNPNSPAELGRSAPLRCFAPLAAVRGVRLISLQKIHGLDQLMDLPADMVVESLGPDFDEGPDGFIDAAAVMTNLDLIIAIDSAVAHLAGALGRRVWLALQAVPYWIWLMEREDSPWYPNTRLFRQAAPGQWQGVFERMAAELAQILEL